MKAQTVDLVLVVDASDSMGPCFDQLRSHLVDLLAPLQQANFQVRFGLVAYAAGRDRNGAVYDHTFVGGSGPKLVKDLYSLQADPGNYFTRDAGIMTRTLGSLKPQGNEDTLLALDIAADLPFGPAESTRRVIALFTDEKLEDGINGGEPIAKLPELIQKIQQRRIHLFIAAPLSSGLEELAAVDKAEIETIDGGDGLKSVDFGKLLAQMGKSISVSSLQGGPEPSWKKAVFGQDHWEAGKFVSINDKSILVKTGEIAGLNVSANKLGVILDVSGSMTEFIPRLRKQIAKNFPNAIYKEVIGCGIDNSCDFLKKVIELVDQDTIDALYWFCDLQDGYDPGALKLLDETLMKSKVVFFVRSVDRNPDSVLASLIKRSGGEVKVGRDIS